jgi:hypothetical protein
LSLVCAPVSRTSLVAKEQVQGTLQGGGYFAAGLCCRRHQVLNIHAIHPYNYLPQRKAKERRHICLCFRVYVRGRNEAWSNAAALEAWESAGPMAVADFFFHGARYRSTPFCS